MKTRDQILLLKLLRMIAECFLGLIPFAIVVTLLQASSDVESSAAVGSQNLTKVSPLPDQGFRLTERSPILAMEWLESQELELTDTLTNSVAAEWSQHFSKHLSATPVVSQPFHLGGFNRTTGGAFHSSTGYALSFDGSNDYVKLPDWNLHNLTIEAWFRSTDLNGLRSILFRENDIQLGTGGWNGLASNKVGFTLELGAGNWVTLGSQQTLNENTWYHVAVTYDHSTMKMYINGELDSQRSADGNIYRNSCTLYWTIGADHAACSDTTRWHWAGILDEVRMWDYARSQDDILSTMNTTLTGNESGLIGYWRFDEGEGQTAVDSSGHGRNGRLGSTAGIDDNDPIWTPVGGATDSDLSLAKKYAPILWLHSDDPFNPNPISVMLDNAQLCKRFLDLCQQVAGPRLTPEDLNDANSDDYYIDLWYAPSWDSKTHYSRYATIASAPKAYARVWTNATHTVIQYWLFYYYNDFYFTNKHEGDWEMVQIVLQGTGPDASPIYAAYSQHELGSRQVWKTYGVDKIGEKQNHPLVYVAKGSHASYFKPGRKPVKLKDLPDPPLDFAQGEDKGRAVSLSGNRLDLLRGTDPPDPLWLQFPGRWGEYDVICTSGRCGPHGPGHGDNKDKWDKPFEWFNSLPWDELAPHYKTTTRVSLADCQSHVLSLTDTQGRHIGADVNEIDPDSRLAEYIRNCDPGGAGRQTILIHDPDVEVGRIDLLPDATIANAVGEARIQQTQPITLEVNLPDYANNLVTQATYTDVTIGITTTGSISVTAGGDLALELDDDGDGTTDQTVDPTLEETEYDFTAPAAVSNLSVTDVITGAVTLSWSAPGDDGLTGTAAAYDLRYYTEHITASNWVSATQIVTPTVPATAGATQTASVSDLLSGTFYFAVRAIDEVGNVGDISNSPGTTIIGYPEADFDHSCLVDVTDVYEVAGRWAMRYGDDSYDLTYDLNQDTYINIVDIMRVVARWGESCGADQPTANLVQNPGFEDGQYDPNQEPDYWTADAWWIGSTFVWDNTQAYSGSKSVRIDSSQNNDARWIQPVPVTPNTNYVLSGWIKTDNVVHDPESAVLAGANLGLYGTWDRTPALFGTNDWTFVSMEFNSEGNTEVTVACRLGYWSGIATGTMWCDDISLTPTTGTSQNLAPNPSFEEGTNSPDGWYGALGGADYGWDDSVAHTGTHSLSISNVAGNRSVEWKTIDFITVNSESDHQASVWVKGTSSLEAYFTVFQYDSDGNSTGPGIGFYLSYASSEWARNAHPIRIHPGTAKAKLALELNNPGPDDTGTVWFDDVYFRPP